MTNPPWSKKCEREAPSIAARLAASRLECSACNFRASNRTPARRPRSSTRRPRSEGAATAATCAALCRRLNGVIDAEIDSADEAGARVACAPGCDYCCHLRVDVFPHEAAALLDYLRTRASPAEAAAIEQRILANAERVDGLTAEQHRSAGIACAFLGGRRCSAHDVRPSACAAYHSLSRERCEHSFRHPADIGTARNARPALLELQVFGTALIEATQALAKRPGSRANSRSCIRRCGRCSTPTCCVVGAGAADRAIVRAPWSFEGGDVKNEQAEPHRLRARFVT